jgi:hypothetical protein
MFARRLVEVFFGVVIIGSSAYAIRNGSFRGAWRSYSRANEPWSFWSAVMVSAALGACFLFGLTSWRE